MGARIFETPSPKAGTRRERRVKVDVDLYRGLRGAAIHIVPYVAKMHTTHAPHCTPGLMPALTHNYREGCTSSDFLRPRKWPMGICRWCGLEVDLGKKGRKLRWHIECQRWYYAARGSAGQGTVIYSDGAYHPTVPHTPCVECGTDDTRYRGELDHRIALGFAVRLGVRVHVRALTRPNMVWLCSPCHKEKTKRDRALMADLDRYYKWGCP